MGSDELIAAAKARNGPALKTLKQQITWDICVTNAARQLATDHDKESGDFLVLHGANPISLAQGACVVNQREFAEYFVGKVVDVSLNDYNNLASSAAWGGNQALAEHFSNKMVDESYNRAAVAAALGNHPEVADYFFNKIVDESKRDYNKAAAGCGYQKLAAKYHALAEQQRTHSATHANTSTTPAASASTPTTESAPLSAPITTLFTSQTNSARSSSPTLLSLQSENAALNLKSRRRLSL